MRRELAINGMAHRVLERSPQLVFQHFSTDMRLQQEDSVVTEGTEARAQKLEQKVHETLATVVSEAPDDTRMTVSDTADQEAIDHAATEVPTYLYDQLPADTSLRLEVVHWEVYNRLKQAYEAQGIFKLPEI